MQLSYFLLLLLASPLSALKEIECNGTNWCSNNVLLCDDSCSISCVLSTYCSSVTVIASNIDSFSIIGTVDNNFENSKFILHNIKNISFKILGSDIDNSYINSIINITSSNNVLMNDISSGCCPDNNYRNIIANLKNINSVNVYSNSQRYSYRVSEWNINNVTTFNHYCINSNCGDNMKIRLYNTSNYYLQCSGHSSCRYLNVKALTNINTVTIDCTGQYSCRDLQDNGINTRLLTANSVATVNCNGQYSCNKMYYYCPDHSLALCKLNCGRKSSETCNPLNLYSINGGSNVMLSCSYYDSINIPFEPDTGLSNTNPFSDSDCYSKITMYCDPVYREYCNIDEAVSFWTMKDDTGIYIGAGYNLTYFCEENTLKFDCVNYDYNPSTVEYVIKEDSTNIDCKNKDSCHVFCESGNSCANMNITCPIDECRVFCSDSASDCINLNIYSTGSNTIQLYSNVENGFNSLNLDIESVSTTELYQILGEYNYRYMNFRGNNLGDINMYCTSNANYNFRSISLLLTNINNFYFDLYSSYYGLRYSTIDIINSNDITMLCGSQSYGCREMTVDIVNANSFYAYGTAWYTLSLTTIILDNVTTNDIICNGQWNCNSLTVRASTSKDTNIECNDRYSCRTLNYYCPSSYYNNITDPKCSLSCNSNDESCNGVNMYSIYGYSDGMAIKCGRYDSVALPFDPNMGMTVSDPINPVCLSDIVLRCHPNYLEWSKLSETITYNEIRNNVTHLIEDINYDLEYNLIENRYDYNCFDDINYNARDYYLGDSDSKYYNTTIICENGKICNIFCSAINSCSFLTVICPLNSDCIIHCSLSNACNNMIIQSTGSNTIKLVTNQNYAFQKSKFIVSNTTLLKLITYGGDYGFNSIEIDTYNMTQIQLLSIAGRYSFQSMSFTSIYTDNIQFLMSDGYFDLRYSIIDTIHTNNLTLQCGIVNNDNACRNMLLRADFTDTITVSSSDYGLYQTNLYLQSNSLSINCFGYGSCQYLLIGASKTNDSSLICSGYDSCRYSTYYCPRIDVVDDPKCTLDCANNQRSCRDFRLGSVGGDNENLDIICSRYDSIDLLSFLDADDGLLNPNPITPVCLEGITLLCNPLYTENCLLSETINYTLIKDDQTGIFIDVEYSVKHSCNSNLWNYDCVDFDYNSYDYFLTSDSSEYSNSTINCNDGKSCTIICSDSNICSDLTINCPERDSNDEIECNVFCVSSNACSNVNIFANNSGLIKITSNVTNGFENSNFKIHNSDNFEVYCGGSGNTYGYQYSNFDIFNVSNVLIQSISGEHNYRSIQFLNVYSDTLNIINSHSYFGLSYSDIEIINVNDVSIDCGSDQYCLRYAQNRLDNIKNLDISGSGNYQMQYSQWVLDNIDMIDITCNGWGSCQNVKIGAAFSNSSTLKCNNQYSCDGSSYYCPSKTRYSNALCILECSNTNGCRNMKVNTISGLSNDNVFIKCTSYNNYDINFDSLTGDILNPITPDLCLETITLYCNPLYTEYCTLRENITYNYENDINNSSLISDVTHEIEPYCLDNIYSFNCINYNFNRFTYFISDETNEYYNTTMKCDDDKSCTIICSESNSCSLSEIICPQGSDIECNVFCISDSACNSVSITANSLDYVRIWSNVSNSFQSSVFDIDNVNTVEIFSHSGDYAYRYVEFNVNNVNNFLFRHNIGRWFGDRTKWLVTNSDSIKYITNGYNYHLQYIELDITNANTLDFINGGSSYTLSRSNLNLQLIDNINFDVNGYASLEYSQITLLNVDSSVFSCSNSFSCQYMLLHSGSSNKSSISCTNRYACRGTTVYFPTSVYGSDYKSSKLDCGSSDNACRDMKLYIVGGLNNENFDITCSHYDSVILDIDPDTGVENPITESCVKDKNVRLYCNPMLIENCVLDESIGYNNIYSGNYIIDAEYYVNFSCVSNLYNFDCVNYEYNEITQQHFVGKEIDDYFNDTISCENGKDCCIYCTNTNACSQAKIICPQNSNNECKIFCTSDESCRNMDITSLYNDKLFLYSNITYAFEYSNIFALKSDSVNMFLTSNAKYAFRYSTINLWNITNINLQSSAQYGFQRINSNIMHVNTLSMASDSSYDIYEYSTFDITDINNLIIIANYYYSFRNSNFRVSNINTVNINSGWGWEFYQAYLEFQNIFNELLVQCTGGRSCQESNIHYLSNINSPKLECLNDYSCRYANFYTYKVPKISLNCRDRFSCQYLNLYHHTPLVKNSVSCDPTQTSCNSLDVFCNYNKATNLYEDSCTITENNIGNEFFYDCEGFECLDFGSCKDANNTNCTFIQLIDNGCDFRSSYELCYKSCGYCSDINEGIFCVEEESFTINKNTGSSFGGDRIIVNSPCFTNSEIQEMQCNFGGILVNGMSYDNNSFLCISPPRISRENSEVQLRVKFGGFYFDKQETFVYNEYCQLNNIKKSVRLNNTFLKIDSNTVTNLIWNPSNYDSYYINIYSSVFSFEDNKFVFDLYNSVPNTGSYPVLIPDYGESITGNQVLQIKYWIEEANDRRRLQLGEAWDCFRNHGWSVCWDGRNQANEAFDDANNLGRTGTWPGESGCYQNSCDAFRHCYWSCRLTVNHGSTIARDITDNHERRGSGACNDNVMDLRNNNVGIGFGSASGATHTSCYSNCLSASRPGGALQTSLGPSTDCTTNPPTKKPSRNPSKKPTMRPSNDPTKRPSNPPSPKPTTPEPTRATTTTTPPPSDDDDDDTDPACIDSESSDDCPSDPPDDGGGSGAWGDPHYVSVDGKRFDFQGRGVFTALLIDAFNFEFQVLNEGRSSWNGVTWTTGVAFRMDNRPDISLWNDYSRRVFTFWINNDTIDLSTFNTKRINNYLTINNFGNTIEFSFDFGLTVTLNTNLGLSITMTCLLNGETRGLLGIFDGNQNNDFTTRNGTEISINSNNRDIYFKFGITWAVLTNNEIIFPNVRVIGDGNNGNTRRRRQLIDIVLDDNYSPVLDLEDIQVNNTEFLLQVNNICNGDNDCIFDALITEDINEGLNTIIEKESIDNIIESVKNKTIEAICYPNCQNNGKCISNGICNCTQGFSGERCEINNQSISITDPLFCSETFDCINSFGNNWYCNISINTCIKPECLNNSDCQNLYNNYFRCELDLNECIPPQCINDNDCYNLLDTNWKCSLNTYTCYQPKCKTNDTCVALFNDQSYCNTNTFKCQKFKAQTLAPTVTNTPSPEMSVFSTTTQSPQCNLDTYQICSCSNSNWNCNIKECLSNNDCINLYGSLYRCDTNTFSCVKRSETLSPTNSPTSQDLLACCTQRHLFSGNNHQEERCFIKSKKSCKSYKRKCVWCDPHSQEGCEQDRINKCQILHSIFSHSKDSP